MRRRDGCGRNTYSGNNKKNFGRLYDAKQLVEAGRNGQFMAKSS